MKKNNHSKSKYCFILFLLFFLFNTNIVQARGVLSDGQISSIFSVFKDMTDIYIKIAYGLIVILFAVGAVKSGLSAQFSRQFGMSGRLSKELYDFILCILIFILGILSYPLIETIVNRIVASSGGNVSGLKLSITPPYLRMGLEENSLHVGKLVCGWFSESF